MGFARAVVAVARLDLADVLRSRWLLFCATVYTVLAGAFVLVGLRESTVLGFTGMSRALLSFVHVLVLLLPLLALTATGQVVARARDDGALELLLSAPIPRSAYLLAVATVRYLVLLLPLLILMFGMSLFGWASYGEPVPWTFVFRCALVSAALIMAFVGLGLTVSTFVGDASKAMIGLLLLWALAVLLLDLGLVSIMLRWRLNARAVFLLAALNPVQSARLALLSGVDAELGALGPVGFYLANRIGAASLFFLGVAWPALVGVLSTTFALRRFCRGDLA
jgi:ABC-2 type transport system permease protein